MSETQKRPDELRKENRTLFNQLRHDAAEDYQPHVTRSERAAIIRDAVKTWTKYSFQPAMKELGFELNGFCESWMTRKNTSGTIRGLTYKVARSGLDSKSSIIVNAMIAGVHCYLGYWPMEKEEHAARAVDLVHYHFRGYRQRNIDNWDSCLNGTKEDVEFDYEQNPWIESLLYRLEKQLLATRLVCPWQYKICDTRHRAPDRRSVKQLREAAAAFTRQLEMARHYFSEEVKGCKASIGEDQKQIDRIVNLGADLESRVEKIEALLILFGKRLDKTDTLVQSVRDDIAGLPELIECVKKLL